MAAGWFKLGTIRRGETGNQYISFAPNAKDKTPLTIEITVKDASGNVLSHVVNPKNLQVQNPRKRPGITPEQVEKVPEWLMAEISLPPVKAS